MAFDTIVALIWFGEGRGPYELFVAVYGDGRGRFRLSNPSLKK